MLTVATTCRAGPHRRAHGTGLVFTYRRYPARRLAAARGITQVREEQEMMRRFPSIVLLAAATTAPAHPPAGLAATYQVRLESAWPRLLGAGCENGGNETVEGMLTRSPGGEYEGTFTRRTRLLFCGAHAASGAACALVLDGEGSVQVHGLVTDDERSPSGRALRLTWTPDANHAATVRGECATEFKEGIRRMYLTARHGAEFALPSAGAAPMSERLEEYAWVVHVQ